MVGKNFSGKQMSEAFINSAFLALSGGFQDAYTYNTRDEVFSNAQTGNVVLMSQHFMTGDWKAGVRYLLPHSLNMTATIFVSFACAMQVQTFRKMGGYSYASTMCIGNLRSGTAAFSHYLQDKKTEQLKQAAYYFGIIFLFAIGAGLGGNLTEHFGIHMIWISCILLGLSFLLMFENE